MSEQKFTLSIEALQETAGQIAELDTRIAAASGNDSQAKKALVDRIVVENSDKVTSILDKVVAQLSKLDGDVLVGLTTALQDRIKAEFQPKVDSFVTEQLAATQGTSKEEVEGLRATRKTLVEKDKAIRTLLESFGLDISSVPEPKRGGGRPAGSGSGTAKSGKNKENYQFTMDGKDRPPSQNTFSSLAYYATDGIPKALGQSEDAKERWGSKQLKAFLAEQGVTFGEQDEWEVTLPNNRKIGARRMPAETPAAEATAEATAA